MALTFENLYQSDPSSDDDSDWEEEGTNDSGESACGPGWVCMRCNEAGELVLCDSCQEVFICL